MLGAADWGALATAWQALGKDEDSDRPRALGLIGQRVRQAIVDALAGILGDLWRKAWDLGARAAARLVGRDMPLTPQDLADFLRRALDALAAIADTLSNRLARVLAAAGAKEKAVTERELREALESAGLWISWSELARAQWAAALAVYRQAAVMYARWQTADDAKVCARCAANEAEGALLLGEAYPSGNAWPPAHPRCRCALLPVEVAVAA